MTKAQHTPGPWEGVDLGDDRIFIQAMPSKENPGGFIAICDHINKDQNIANASLITAATELLEALEMVRDADEDCKRDGFPTIPPIARAKIDNAIAKARGNNE